jgi:hypothetical protein
MDNSMKICKEEYGVFQSRAKNAVEEKMWNELPPKRNPGRLFPTIKPKSVRFRENQVGHDTRLMPWATERSQYRYPAGKGAILGPRICL